MKKRCSEEHIIGILKEAEAGAPAKELCRKYGMSDASFYKWKAKYRGMELSEAKRHLRKFNGVPKAQFGLYLKECEWRFNNSDPLAQKTIPRQWVKKHLR